jgi:hypothetical protein
METIYIKLLDEGTEVWRPVKAKRLTESTFLIINQNIEFDEKWEFYPNQIVHCKQKIFSDNKQGLVAYKTIKES